MDFSGPFSCFLQPCVSSPLSFPSLPAGSSVYILLLPLLLAHCCCCGVSVLVRTLKFSCLCAAHFLLLQIKSIKFYSNLIWPSWHRYSVYNYEYSYIYIHIFIVYCISLGAFLCFSLLVFYFWQCCGRLFIYVRFLWPSKVCFLACIFDIFREAE